MTVPVPQTPAPPPPLERPGPNRATLPRWAKPFLSPARYKSASGGRGSGKALLDDTPIATPDGWVRIADLCVGDRVFGSDGSPVVVTGVHPQGDRPVWAVRARYADPLYADGQHLWRMTDHPWRKRRNRRGLDYADWRDIRPQTTEQLAGCVTHGPRADLNLSLPLAGALRLPEADLTVPPYVLGLWLGDGTSTQGALTCTVDDAQHYGRRLAELGEELHDPYASRLGRSAWTYPVSKGYGTGRRRAEALTGRLRALGVLNDKHVPVAYLRASVGQRLELLAGLIDTDGTISAAGREATFTTTNERLARDVYDLVVGLGQRPSRRRSAAVLDGRTVGTAWDIAFFPFAGCASLPRKVARIRAKRSQANRDRQRIVTGIEPTGDVAPMTCITVDAPDAMFLAGPDLIPTHNSHGLSMLAVMRMANRVPGYPRGPVRIASARQFQSSIQESVKQAVELYIHALGLTHEFRIGKFEINHRTNGSHMFFPGFSRNPDSLRSTEALDILWIEEAQSLQDEMEIIIPTVRKDGSELWFSWNPYRRSDWCWRRFRQNARPDDVSVHLTWRDNPWFPEALKVERDAMRLEEPDRFPHVWLGTPDTDAGKQKVLTYGLLQKVVDAWPYRFEGTMLPPGTVQVGLDVADSGSAYNSLTTRRGPVVSHLSRWRGATLGETARRADAWCRNEGAAALGYDRTGIGGAIASYLDDFGVRPYTAQPINFGGAVEGPDVQYDRRTSNADYFARRNAQLAWAVYLRAMATTFRVEALSNDLAGSSSPALDRCLFIDPDLPDLEELLTQLSQPEWDVDPSGRIRIDKEPDGAPSPDAYDSTVLSFYRDSQGRGLRAANYRPARR